MIFTCLSFGTILSFLLDALEFLEIELKKSASRHDQELFMHALGNAKQDQSAAIVVAIFFSSSNDHRLQSTALTVLSKMSKRCQESLHTIFIFFSVEILDIPSQARSDLLHYFLNTQADEYFRKETLAILMKHPVVNEVEQVITALSTEKSNFVWTNSVELLKRYI